MQGSLHAGNGPRRARRPYSGGGSAGICEAWWWTWPSGRSSALRTD